MFRISLLMTALAILPLGWFLSQGQRPLSPATVQTQTVAPVKKAASGVNWVPYDQALSQANTQKKPVYIQFHATWCPYCKKLEQLSYSQPAIQQLLNQAFVPVRLTEGDGARYRVDGQSLSVQDLFLHYQVSGFPTLVFLEPDGKLIGKIPGYVEPKDFHSLLRYVHSQSYKRMDFEAFRKKNN